MEVIQDPIKRKKLYDYLASEKMTTLDYETFSNEYANNTEKQTKLFTYLKDNGMTTLDQDKFNSEYFGDLKKKDTSESTVPNQKLDSEAKGTDGSLATPQDKNIPVTFGADGLEQTSFLDKEKRNEQFADTVNATINNEKSYIKELISDKPTDISPENIPDAILKFGSSRDNALKGLNRIPLFMLEQVATFIAPKEIKEKLNELPINEREDAIIKLAQGTPGLEVLGFLSEKGRENYEEFKDMAEYIENGMTKYETALSEDFGMGKNPDFNLGQATYRSFNEVVGAIPSFIQAAIPYVGLASMGAGTAANESRDSQEQGMDLDWKTSANATVYGLAEATLEKVSQGIGKKFLKGLLAEPSEQALKSISSFVKETIKNSGAEGLSETGTLFIQKLSDKYIKGDNDAFADTLNEFLDTAIIGALSGGAISGSGNGVQVLNSVVTKRKVNRDLENFEGSDNITNSDIEAVELTKDNEDFVKNELASEKYENWQSIKEQLKSVPEDYNTEEKTKAVELLKQRSELEKKIEGKDPALVETEKARIEEINNELKSIKNPNAQKQESTQEETKSEVLPTKNEEVQTEVIDTREGINEGKNEGITPVKVQDNETTQTENTPTNEGTESNIDIQEQGVQSKPSEEVTTFETKGGYTVTKNKDNSLTVVNKKGEEPKSPSTKRKQLKEYAKTVDFTQGEKYKPQGNVSESSGIDIDNEVATNSKNPAELAEVALRTSTKQFIEGNVDQDAVNIIEYIAKRVKRGKKGGGNDGSFANISDTNNITNAIARTYFSKKGDEGVGLDVLAQEVSEEFGKDFTEQDLVDYMLMYPNGISDIEKSVRDKYSNPAKQSFSEITGFPASDYYLKIAVEQAKKKEKLDDVEQNTYLDSLTEEELVNLHKEREQYEKTIEQGTERVSEIGNTTDSKEQSGVQEGTNKTDGEQKTEQGEVNDDTQAQGVSLNKENNRDSALSKEGAVKQKNARQRAFKRFWNNTFSSTRGLDKKVVREIESLMGDLAAISSALEYEASQFAKMSKQILKQDKKNYNENLKKINDYLSGDTSVDLSFLKDQQKEQLDAFRGRIDNLSDKIIQVLNDKKKRLKSDDAIKRVDALIETIEGNKGKYMFRQYDAFSNDKYLDGLTGKYPNNAAKKRLDNAIEYVSNEEGITKDEAKTQILEYLDSLKGNNDFVSATATGKAKAPFLKRRKDIPEPIRELLGESKDPVKNYIATVLNMSKYIANIEYQSRLSDALDKTGLSKDKIEPGYTKLIKSSEGWDLLQDIYVPDEVAESIEDLQPLDSIQDGVYRGLVQLAAVTKLGKTVLSPTTTARNLLSGIFLSLNNGFNPFRNPKRFVRAIQHSWGTKKTNTELKAENQRLIKLGIIKDGAVSREVLGILNDAQLPVDKILKKNALEKFLDVMQKAYALGDDAYKAVGFYVWEQRYKDAGLSDADAEIAAADRIRNGFPTYSKIPKNIQKLRRIPLVGTFPSFAYEVWRTSFNNVRFIGQDIKAATTDSNGDMKPVKDWDKRRLLMAHQQATGMIIANSMAYALSSLSMALLGISDEEDETTKNMSAPWQKDSTNIYVGQEDGNYQVIDASAFFPSETMFKPVRILTEQREGRDIDDKIKLSLKSATDAFFDTDIFTQTAMDLMTNKNGYGQEIYKGDSFMEGIGNDPDKIINYVLKQAGPGIYNNISEFARANEVFPDYFGNKETSYKEYTNIEALMGLMGIRLSRINYINGINSIAYDTKDKYQKARNETLSEIKSTKKMSDEDIQDLVKDYKDYNKEYHKQVILSVSGAKKQGIEKQKIEKALKNAGYSNADIDRIYMGKEPLLKPLSTTTFNNKMDKLDIGRFSNDKAKLKEVKQNIQTKAELFKKYVDEYNKEAIKS